MLLGGLIGTALAPFHRVALGWLGRLQASSVAPIEARAEVIQVVFRVAGVATRPVLIQALVVAVIGLVILAVGVFVGPADVDNASRRYRGGD